MPEGNTNDEKISLLENLLAIANLHWPESYTNKIKPQITQTALHLDTIIHDIPDSTLEP